MKKRDITIDRRLTVKKELIKAGKIEKKMTIVEFCKECHISKRTYYSIMKEGKCNFYSLVRIADFLKVRFVTLIS